MKMTERIVNRFVKSGVVALIFISGLAVYHRAYAQVKCETDRNGAVCCWDVKQFGPFKPFSCN
jgi:hypothetical protein